MSQFEANREHVVCVACGHTEDLETAKELWAATYIGGHLVNWICGECWHSDPTEGLPDDLARVLRDQSIIVPQDGAVFDLIARWRDAPSNTASAD